MLTATEDLLDSWPGTLIVVSHDRYLLERVTDQQYAIIDGRLRHLPGGVEEYLRLRHEQSSARRAEPGVAGNAEPSSAGGLTGAQRRAAHKEVASIERRLDKLGDEVRRLHQQMAEHEQSDYEGLQRLADELGAVEDQIVTLEERWMELSDLIS
ncbi:hypothetical protein [uncultured Aeromicrobium sp.]|uniref:hypothetical protein n=1 Tax=uncultured Aeromicrobium sp. TaxID=337820 RepID=UPI0025F7EEC7|nr:hypothetical protein [uncultured Aeromicrobium sp.]